MEIRAEAGGQGVPLAQFGTYSGSGEGVEVTYLPTFPDPITCEVVGASQVRVFIDEATLEALSYGARASDHLTLHYDIHITPTGSKKFVFSEGEFTINPGVTI